MNNPFTTYDNPFALLYEEIKSNRKLISELHNAINKLVADKETYLSPDEARNMFKPKLSKSTLYRWDKKGIIKHYIMGGRICYKLTEVQIAVENNVVYKAKCPVETGQILQ